MQIFTQAVLASQGQHQALPPQQVLVHEVAFPVPTSQPQAVPSISKQLYYYLEEVGQNDLESFPPWWSPSLF
jgi:hypothetical protein